MTEQNSNFIRWFRSASPYIRVHTGRTFVIHIEDVAVHSESFIDLVHDLALLNSLKIRLVLVYSTRHSIESRLHSRDIDSRYHRGMRITDPVTLEHVKDTAGKLRIELESALSTGLGNTPMSNANVIVSSGNYVSARPLGIIDGIDYKFTGVVRNIETAAINARLQANEIVLIPPLGYSVTGETFNLDARTLALRVATGLQADKLIYLMESPCLTDEAGRPVSQMTRLEAEALLASGTTGDAVLDACLDHAIKACTAGVGRVHLLERAVDGALVKELFSRDGAGTLISSTSYDALRQAGIHDIPGILELIGPLEKEGVLVARSREKLELEIDNFTVMLRDEVIIGCASLYVFPEEGAAEVACMVIHPEYRNSERGQQLLSALEQIAGKSGVRRLYVLTTHATHWFRELGFSESSLDELPVEKKKCYNYQRNSRVLMKNL